MKLERVKRELGLDEQELSFLVGSEGRLKERMAQLGMGVVRETLIRHRWNKSRAAVELATTALVAGVLGARLLIRLARVNAAIAFFATLPGGVAEMSITAQVLHLDVPLVTACHVLRVIVLTVGAVPVYRWYARRVGGVG